MAVWLEEAARIIADPCHLNLPECMLHKVWRDWRFPIEFALLLGLAFFLPLREAPKNLLWLAYTITWILNRVTSREFGGSWDRWDSLFVTWIASGYLAALFAGIRTPDAN